MVMIIHFWRFKRPRLLNWVHFTFSFNPPSSPFRVVPNPRFYARKSSGDVDVSWSTARASFISASNGRKLSRATWTAAQAVLLDYLHTTRSFQLPDAEHISKNCPHFLCKIILKIEDDPVDIKRSITRFLRYHPVNEFEPFFESLGLNPSEYAPLLPRDLMFLSDDALLLENYRILCNYGIPRAKIGKIYKEATKVFQYDKGILLSRLKAYEELGLNQSDGAKFFVSIPSLLTGRVDGAFVEVLAILQKMGFDCVWIENQMSENESYSWSQMLHFLHFLGEIGGGEERLIALIGQRPDLLFISSGNVAISLIGLLLKFGFNMDEIYNLILQLPEIQVVKFVQNLLGVIFLLKDIDMETEEIGKIICCHTLLLGTYSLKSTKSLLSLLNIGKKRLAAIIKDNPLELGKWVIGKRVDPIQTDDLSQARKIKFLSYKKKKIKFLLELGFTKDSKEMEKALKVFRGSGNELKDRFNCLVKAGLDRKDVIGMVKTSPHVLNQSIDVIEKKMDFLVNGLGYPISALMAFPSYLSYTIERVKLRHSMYDWLKSQGAAFPKRKKKSKSAALSKRIKKSQGAADPTLALCSIISCSDEYFIKFFVNRLPEGPEMWINLKKGIYPEV